MHPAALCFLLLLAPLAVGRAQDLPLERRLRLATYNVENLFDNHDEPNRPDEETSPKSDAELAVLARTIDALDADVLALQEVENAAIAVALNGRLARPFAFVEVLPGNDVRGIHCALLSRVALRRALGHRFWPLEGGRRFARDLAVFELQPSEGTSLLVAPVHLKSKRTSEDGDPQGALWREAEARAIVAIRDDLRRLGLTTPLVVAGDLNDLPDSKPLAILGERLTDATSLVPEAERWSYVFEGRKQQIDYVLHESGLEPRRAFFVHDAESASDHAPLAVDFAWPKPIVRVAAPAATASGGREPDVPKLQANDLVGLRAHLLREVEVEGVVERVRATERGGHLQVEFARDARQALTAFVPQHAVARLGDLAPLAGPRVSVRGPVFLYRGRFEIRLTRPVQIRKLP
jgi:endonuclease/exonuclease/phosphatase family metal-dependent hydrolase